MNTENLTKLLSEKSQTELKNIRALIESAYLSAAGRKALADCVREDCLSLSDVYSISVMSFNLLSQNNKQNDYNIIKQRMSII